MGNMFTSSIGKKLIMSLAGIFLLSFLVVHLVINLLVLKENTDSFNLAANFMATNPIIKIMEIVLFGGFFLHMIYGVIVSIQNMLARGNKRYKVTTNNQLSFFSKYMFHTAVVITVFLVIHLADFYFKAKFFHGADEIMINGKTLHDLGALVIAKFQILPYSIFYIVALLILAFHLHHGFQSAFQTLGINHKTYTPFIKAIGVIYSIIVPLGFIIIPVAIYFFN